MATLSERHPSPATFSQVVPQKKFSFGKSVTRTAADTLASSAQSVQVPSEALSPRIAGAGPVTPSATHSGRVVHGRVGETILLGPKELDGIDVTLSGLEACTVVLLGSLGAIRLDRIRKCCVVAASVKGSVFLEGVEDCKLFLASRQVRGSPLGVPDCVLLVAQQSASEMHRRDRDSYPGKRMAPCSLRGYGVALQTLIGTRANAPDEPGCCLQQWCSLRCRFHPLDPGPR